MNTTVTPLYIYQVVTDPKFLEGNSLYMFELWAGPYLDGNAAMQDAEALRQSQPDVYYSCVVTHYRGERWFYHCTKRTDIKGS
ncbi:MAG: hypothetical protein SFW36_19710 [Leptolyngbyaceae cyanobacterium bins.59]|nr:hypothetical protein [Leptolyngbyaceae cyanobacterium bins.59]